MVPLITAVSSLIGSIAFLAGMLFLHRLAKPLSHALMNVSLNAAGKRLARVFKLAENGRAVLTTPDSNDDRG